MSRAQWTALCAVIAAVITYGSPAVAQSFSSGSTGALEAFNPSSNTTVTLPADGILNYTAINIPSGVTVKFTRNSANTPVTMLATGNVTIAGVIDVSGSHAVAGCSSGSLVNPGALGGPGGFSGGQGARRSTVRKNGAAGQGPGGGKGGLLPSVTTADGGYGAPSSFVGLIPLFGGSGGGGGATGTTNESGWAGAGGGGAIVIASTTSITIQGSGEIRANGGNGLYYYGNCNWQSGGAGSGGAIRLVAPTVNNQGMIRAIAGSTGCPPPGPSNGRIRIECTTCTTPNQVPSASVSNTLGPITAASTPALTNVPTLTITQVGGSTAPSTPGDVYGTADRDARVVCYPQGRSRSSAFRTRTRYSA